MGPTPIPRSSSTPSEDGAAIISGRALCFLTAAHAKQTSGPDVLNGTSIDQLYAQQFGKDTRLPSFQLCIENIGLNGSCGYEYNCIYSETISWASPTDPVPMTVNPRVAFESLLTEPGRDRTARRQAGRSVLDGIAPAADHLQRDIGAADREPAQHAYLEEVRRIERRIQAIEKRNATAGKRELAAPLGVPDSWEEHVKLMFDLQVLAFAAGDYARLRHSK